MTSLKENKLSTKNILSFSIFVIILMTQKSLAETNDLNEEFDRLKKVKTCIETLRSANEHHKLIINTWLTAGSKYDIASNFKILKERHHQHLQAVSEFSRTKLEAPKDFGDLSNAIQLLDQSYIAVSEDHTRLKNADESFALSMNSINASLSQLASAYMSAKDTCDDSHQDMIIAANESIKNLRMQILNYQTYTQEASTKRQLLHTAVLQGIKVKYMTAFSKESRTSFEDLSSKINSILAADSVYGRIQKWWHLASIANGLGRGSLLLELQYTESLQNLRSDAQIGLEFQRELESLKDMPPTIRSTIESELDTYVKLISDQITALEKGGYKQLFERQKILSSKRYTLRHQYNKNCQQAIIAFEESAAKVRDYQSFAASELLYKRQVHACRGD